MSESFDRALRAAARRSRPAGVCLDAAMLASYADNGLSPDERRHVEAHAADCARCQEHLALLGAVSLDREVPEPGRSWLVRWGWLVPVATAVLVVAVWVRLPEPTQDQRAVPVASSDAATPAAQDTPAVEASAAAATAASPERDEADAQFAGKAKPLAPAGTAASAEAKVDQLAPLERRDEARENAARAPVRPLGDVAGAVAAPPAPAAVPPPAAVMEAKEELQVADSARQRAPEPQLRKSAVGQETSIAAAAPDESYRFAGHRIDLSEDGGRTWREVLSDSQVVFTTARCAPGGPCWFGTADGQVLRRTPAGFTRSALPMRARVVAITPSGPQTVTVSLDTGQRFGTTDGGTTWTSVP